MTQVTIFQGDIARQSAEAIVNSVNARLAGGGGVDGAIRAAAGPAMAAALADLPAPAPATAVVTPGFRLPARFVIHALAPRWEGGAGGSARLAAFRDTHAACLRAARRLGAGSLAFPALGVGAFGWPLDVAADAAMEAVGDWIEAGSGGPGLIAFVCASPAMTAIYRRAAEDWELPLGAPALAVATAAAA